MAIKESVAYSKDLITGRKIEQVKKKTMVSYEGTTTVKLYDDLIWKANL